ncbi:KamA family radical SAM protein [Sedimentibacter sp.]|uniref:KamA family radical SAM protein n=1 Tax=Sedimentibacter sp. TaxID=1960295 RepID=UPI00289DA290|nr:KamA family radical SAM protein [Sedimentibacter sp.]
MTGVERMDWKESLKNNITTADEINEALNWILSEEEKNKFNEIIDRYPMSIPHYYLSLINKDDPEDPIRKLCVPSILETDMSGSFDTSGEASNTVVSGLQHKYKQTGMYLSTNQCAMYCRHCFRKRLVGVNDDEINKDFDDVVKYIKEHKEMSNVLISGGDSFMNSNKKIKKILDEFTKIEHLSFLRFGTRTPVVLPSRIYGDDELLGILEHYSKIKQIYVITHFNHPNEITKESTMAIEALRNIGIVVRNQTVLLKGINDNSETLAALMKGLVEIGANPYYIFQCRPVSGVKNQFQVPFAEAVDIIDEARSKISGISKSFKYAMSHPTGKIEIIGKLKDDEVLFKYHQAKYEKDQGRLISIKVTPEQAWLDKII